MIRKDEIRAGLVLHLDPDTLEQNGATFTCATERRVRGGHFFLCLKTNGVRSKWLPLFSEDRPGRTEIGREGRTGHPKWTEATCYWNREQIWDSPVEAIAAAATAGADQSSSDNRNRLDKSRMPEP